MKDTVVRYLLGYLFSLPVILLSLSVHELSHGFVSDKLGDPTARSMGRLTLNPLKHIDPIGFIALLLFHIGWARPVMVDARNFKKPKRDMAFTALAGPVSNFILAGIFVLVFNLLISFGGANQFLYIRAFIFVKGIGYLGEGVNLISILTMLAYYGVILNVGLGVFNLIPVPPLDGSKVLYAFLPNRILYKIMPYERYMQFALILLLWFGILTVPLNWILNPIDKYLIDNATGAYLKWLLS